MPPERHHQYLYACLLSILSDSDSDCHYCQYWQQTHDHSLNFKGHISIPNSCMYYLIGVVLYIPGDNQSSAQNFHLHEHCTIVHAHLLNLSLLQLTCSITGYFTTTTGVYREHIHMYPAQQGITDTWHHIHRTKSWVRG